MRDIEQFREQTVTNETMDFVIRFNFYETEEYGGYSEITDELLVDYSGSFTAKEFEERYKRMYKKDLLEVFSEKLNFKQSEEI